LPLKIKLLKKIKKNVILSFQIKN